jgi:hypothetical protein
MFRVPTVCSTVVTYGGVDRPRKSGFVGTINGQRNNPHVYGKCLLFAKPFPSGQRCRSSNVKMSDCLGVMWSAWAALIDRTKPNMAEFEC